MTVIEAIEKWVVSGYEGKRLTETVGNFAKLRWYFFPKFLYEQEKSRFLFMITGREVIMNGRDFHDERLRFYYERLRFS